MAIPVLIIGITAAVRGRVGATALSAIALLLFRDDLGLAIAGDRRDRLLQRPRPAVDAMGSDRGRGDAAGQVIGGQIALGLGVDRLVAAALHATSAPARWTSIAHPCRSVARADRAALQRRVARAGDALARDGGVPARARAEAAAAHDRRRAPGACGRTGRIRAQPLLPPRSGHRSVPLLGGGRRRSSGGRRSPASLCCTAFVVPAAAIVVLVLRGRPVAAGDFDRSPVEPHRRRRGTRRRLAARRSAPRPARRGRATSQTRDGAPLPAIPSPPIAGRCRAVAGERNVALWPASEVDTSVLPAARTAPSRPTPTSILKSPCFADLGPPEHIGGLSCGLPSGRCPTGGSAYTERTPAWYPATYRAPGPTSPWRATRLSPPAATRAIRLRSKGGTTQHAAAPDPAPGAVHRRRPRRARAAHRARPRRRSAIGVFILGHHYQRDEVMRWADARGDSFRLSVLAQQQPDAEFIVFCGVHFMAESADILTGDHQQVILPDLNAGLLDGRHGRHRRGRGGVGGARRRHRHRPASSRSPT